jgi:hypothetical protein
MLAPDRPPGEEAAMDLERRLKRALSAVEDAQEALMRAQRSGGQGSEVQRALRELDAAEADIRRALREVRQEPRLGSVSVGPRGDRGPAQFTATDGKQTVSC